MAFALTTIGSITLFFVSRCGYPYPTCNVCSGLLNASTRCPIINSLRWGIHRAGSTKHYDQYTVCDQQVQLLVKNRQSQVLGHVMCFLALSLSSAPSVILNIVLTWSSIVFVYWFIATRFLQPYTIFLKITAWKDKRLIHMTILRFENRRLPKWTFLRLKESRAVDSLAGHRKLKTWIVKRKWNLNSFFNTHSPLLFHWSPLI